LALLGMMAKAGRTARAGLTARAGQTDREGQIARAGAADPEADTTLCWGPSMELLLPANRHPSLGCWHFLA